MSVIGNDPTVGGEKGRRSCEAAILANCRKLRALVSETPERWNRQMYLTLLDRVQDSVAMMERLKPLEETSDE